MGRFSSATISWVFGFQHDLGHPLWWCADPMAAVNPQRPARSSHVGLQRAFCSFHQLAGFQRSDSVATSRLPTRSPERLTANSIAESGRVLKEHRVCHLRHRALGRSRWLNVIIYDRAIRLLAISDEASSVGLSSSAVTRSGLVQLGQLDGTWPSPASTISYPSSPAACSRSMRMGASSSAIKTRRGTAASASVVGPVATDMANVSGRVGNLGGGSRDVAPLSRKTDQASCPNWQRKRTQETRVRCGFESPRELKRTPEAPTGVKR